MKRVGLLGLSGSGKTVYLTMINNDLSKGVVFTCGGGLKVLSEANQNSLLSYNYRLMSHERSWPAGTLELCRYNFLCCLSPSNQYMPFTIKDYCGGWLVDINHRDEMLDEFNECNAIIVLVGADMLRQLLCFDHDSMYYLDWLKEFLYVMLGKKVDCGYSLPSVMFTISKSDYFSNILELRQADAFIREQFGLCFCTGTNLLSGITHMHVMHELGIDGALYCNIAIPILFSLFGNIFLQNDDTLTNSESLIKHAILNDARIYYNGIPV